MTGRFAMLLATAGAASLIGCGIIAAPDRDKIPILSQGGSSAGGGGGATGGGGVGGAECETAEDCTNATECQTAACEEGACVLTNNDGDTCSQGYCDGGDCVQCLIDDHCPGSATCNMASKLCEGGDDCSSGQLDGMETDVDCGGPECDPCVNGQTCAVFSDCTSGYCDTSGGAGGGGGAAPTGTCSVCLFGSGHCQPDQFCSNGLCVPKLADGSPCVDPGQCLGGMCVNDMCAS